MRRLWGLADGSCLRTFEGHLASVLRLSFLSAGTQLLSSGADGLLKLWSVRTAECTATFDAHEDKVGWLGVGPQGQAQRSAGRGKCNSKCWKSPQQVGPTWLDLSPAAARRGGGGVGRLCLLGRVPLLSRQACRPLQVWALAVGGADESVVATGGGDGAVALWEDCTQEDAATTAREMQEAVLREQELLNALQVGVRKGGKGLQAVWWGCEQPADTRSSMPCCFSMHCIFPPIYYML